jgi:hypothetical protein
VKALAAVPRPLLALAVAAGALGVAGATLLFSGEARCDEPVVSLLTVHPQRLRMIHLTRPDCTVRLLAWDEDAPLDDEAKPEITLAAADIAVEVNDRIVTARLQPGSLRPTGFSLAIGTATGSVLIERARRG